MSGMHPVGPSTDYLICDDCDYCAQTDPNFTSWRDHWGTHRVYRTLPVSAFLRGARR